MKKESRFTLAAIAAAVLGYIAGVLTAPKSGKETRKDIKDKAVSTRDELAAKLDTLQKELNDTLTTAKTKLKNVEESVRAEFENAVNHAVIAKDKAKDMATAVRNGDANDKDLKNAVKDVNKAVENLKKYIQKNG